MSISDDLKDLCGRENVFLDEPMSKHTTFRIGGNADFFVTPDTESKIVSVLEYAQTNGIPYYVTGNGSNLLVKDKGFRGIIINIYKNFSDICAEDDIIKAQSGALLSNVARTAMKASLAGMECLSGIPGTLGGAVCMNAGAYGGEMKDIVVESRVINKGHIETISNADSLFSYRTSRIQKENMIVLSSVLKLQHGDRTSIEEKMKEYAGKRNSKQPVELPSAGSTFKRPEGYFAGKLIDDCGLRGYSVGDAQVSPKHCGFVVNNANASAEDVIKLMEHVEETVYSKFGVKLEREVRVIGE